MSKLGYITRRNRRSSSGREHKGERLAHWLGVAVWSACRVLPVGRSLLAVAIVATDVVATRRQGTGSGRLWLRL